nr:hypothetical protein Itr_chr09CG12880 [Ipomoea trifida]
MSRVDGAGSCFSSYSATPDAAPRALVDGERDAGKDGGDGRRATSRFRRRPASSFPPCDGLPLLLRWKRLQEMAEAAFFFFGLPTAMENDSGCGSYFILQAASFMETDGALSNG